MRPASNRLPSRALSRWETNIGDDQITALTHFSRTIIILGATTAEVHPGSQGGQIPKNLSPPTRRKGIFTGMFFSSYHTQGRVSFLVCFFPDANRAASRRIDSPNAGQGESVPRGISQAT